MCGTPHRLVPSSQLSRSHSQQYFFLFRNSLRTWNSLVVFFSGLIDAIEGFPYLLYKMFGPPLWVLTLLFLNNFASNLSQRALEYVWEKDILIPIRPRRQRAAHLARRCVLFRWEEWWLFIQTNHEHHRSSRSPVNHDFHPSVPNNFDDIIINYSPADTDQMNYIVGRGRVKRGYFFNIKGSM